jgi:GNAT superfamily N-acetyltransferase
MKVTAKNSDPHLVVVYEQDLSPALNEAICRLLVRCFPADRDYYSRQSWWRCIPAYRVVGIDKAGSLFAHAAVVDRRVFVEPTSLGVRVAGIQSFCVLPDYRGTGLSDRMMAVAMEEAQGRGFDAGLLFCISRPEPVYQRMGWTGLDAVVYMQDEKQGRTPIPPKNITMCFPLKVGRFPPGDIDLAGADW